jgi:DNA primase
LQQWDEQHTVAEYIFSELEEYHIENLQLDNLVAVYKEMYEQGLQPTPKTLSYNEDEQIRTLVINLNVQQYELSPNWDVIMQGMNINNRDTSRQDVIMSLNYFKLRKIKRMFDENQQDMAKAATFEEQLDLIKVHQHLKEEEQKITKQLGTVIFK